MSLLRPNQLLRPLFVALTFVVVQAPQAAWACATCMGDENSNEAGAINAAIFLMLGFIGSVLGLLCVFAYHLYRRSQMPVPPHVQLAEMIGAQSK